MGSKDGIDPDDFDEMDELDESPQARMGNQTRGVRQLHVMPQLIKNKQDSFGHKKNKGKGIAMKKHVSDQGTVMPSMNYFLEKKRKHEEEFSQMTTSTFNSDKPGSRQGSYKERVVIEKISRDSTHK